jgi:hypothetical protein
VAAALNQAAMWERIINERKYTRGSRGFHSTLTIHGQDVGKNRSPAASWL